MTGSMRNVRGRRRRGRHNPPSNSHRPTDRYHRLNTNRTLASLECQDSGELTVRAASFENTGRGVADSQQGGDDKEPEELHD